MTKHLFFLSRYFLNSFHIFHVFCIRFQKKNFQVFPFHHSLVDCYQTGKETNNNKNRTSARNFVVKCLVGQKKGVFSVHSKWIICRRCGNWNRWQEILLVSADIDLWNGNTRWFLLVVWKSGFGSAQNIMKMKLWIQLRTNWGYLGSAFGETLLSVLKRSFNRSIFEQLDLVLDLISDCFFLFRDRWCRFCNQFDTSQSFPLTTKKKKTFEVWWITFKSHSVT